MIRNALSIILNVIAGFFFYMVSLLGFISESSVNAKWVVMLGFTIPGVLALCAGLAVMRFRNWRRNTGIVLLSAAGFTTFLIFMFAILLMTEEFRVMMQPDTLTFFGDYFTGGFVIAGLAIVGLLLLMTNNGGAEQNATVGAQGSRR